MSRILVVDDSGIARKFVIRTLDMSGLEDAEFLEAGDGAEALEVLESGPADLVVSDLNMPNMDGEQLLVKLKESPAFKDIPVLLITSAANEALRAQLMGQGAFDVFSKPVSPADLFPVLQRLSLAEGDPE